MTCRESFEDYELETVAKARDWSRVSYHDPSASMVRTRFGEVAERIADVVLVAAWREWSWREYDAGWIEDGGERIERFAAWFLDDEIKDCQ